MLMLKHPFRKYADGGVVTPQSEPSLQVRSHDDSIESFQANKVNVIYDDVI